MQECGFLPFEDPLAGELWSKTCRYLDRDIIDKLVKIDR